MSTRGIIARKTGRRSWEGVYHHFDSYPTCLGKTIWDMIHNEFNGNAEEFLKFAIDEHPAGWSHIMDGNIFTEDFTKFEQGKQCYCHGYLAERDGISPDKSLLIRYPECNRDPQERYLNCLFWEWIYVIDPKKNTMTIFCNYDTKRKFKVKDTGEDGTYYEYDSTMFAFKKVTTVKLDGPEPDWEKIEDKEELYTNSLRKVDYLVPKFARDK
jgi:hypothetical protein